MFKSDISLITSGGQESYFYSNISKELCVPTHAFVAQHDDILFPVHTYFLSFTVSYEFNIFISLVT